MTTMLHGPATTPDHEPARGTGARWRATLRLARREVWRAKGRSLLIVAMIGIPVLLISALAVFVQTEYGDDTQEARRQLGSADAAVFPQGRHPVRQQPLRTWGEPVDSASDSSASDSAPADPWTAADIAAAVGGDVTELRTGSARVRTEAGAIAASVRELDTTDPLGAERYELKSGRPATNADEVMVSPAVAEALGADPTGSVITVDSDTEIQPTVTGVVRDPHEFDGVHLFAPLGAVLDAGAADTIYLVDTGGAEVSWDQVQQLNSQGLVVLSQAVVNDPPEVEQSATAGQPETTMVIALVVLTIVLEVILLCGPAFAVGARRSRREHALLVAAGGSARDVRRAVLAQALVLGCGAAVAGAALGVVVIALGRPALELVIRRSMAPLYVPVLELVVLVGIGTLAAVIAALVPASQASRLNVVAALAGRPSQPSGRAAWPLLGLVLAGVGFAAVLTGVDSEIQIALGTVVLVLGALMLVPFAIGVVGRLGTVLPLPLRLATRDASRNRGRATPAVAAIMGAVAGVTALAIGSASDHAEALRDYVPTAPDGTLTVGMHSSAEAGPNPQTVTTIADQIESILPGRSVERLHRAPATARGASVLAPGEDLGTDSAAGDAPDQAGGTGPPEILPLIGDADAVRARTGVQLSPEQRELLDSGGVLLPREELLAANGTATVPTYEFDPEAYTNGTDPFRDVRQNTLPAAVAPELGAHQTGGVEDMFALTVETAEQLGLSPIVDELVVAAGGPAITEAQEAEIGEFVTGLMPFGNVYVERGYTVSYAIPFLALAIAGGLIVLLATATATALANTDARPDLTTLAAVGGAPRTQRWMAMSQAAVIAGLGVVLGVIVGLAPGIVVTYPLTAHGSGGHILVIPWELLGIVAAAVPLLAVLGTGLFARPRRLLPASGS